MKKMSLEDKKTRYAALTREYNAIKRKRAKFDRDDRAGWQQLQNQGSELYRQRKELFVEIVAAEVAVDAADVPMLRLLQCGYMGAPATVAKALAEIGIRTVADAIANWQVVEHRASPQNHQRVKSCLKAVGFEFVPKQTTIRRKSEK